ncbi:MAG: hypothetical protein ACUVTX_10105, partial [Bacteroidales bacterium]
TDEFRSINEQIGYILDQALRKAGRWKPKSGSYDHNEKRMLLMVNFCPRMVLSCIVAGREW